MYIHVYIHTCMHTHIHAYIHTYIHTYICYMRTCLVSTYVCICLVRSLLLLIYKVPITLITVVRLATAKLTAGVIINIIIALMIRRTKSKNNNNRANHSNA